MDVMDVMTAIEKRREITKFTNKEIPGQVLEQLIQSLYLAPSGNNLPSREFILVEDKDLLGKLSNTTPYMKWLSDAAAGIVITGNQKLSKYWLQDASIAGAFLWLSAVSHGLGAAWGAVYHAESEQESAEREVYVRKLLQIPDDLRVVAVLGLGYPEVEPEPKEMYSLQTVFHRGRYGDH